MVCISQIQPHQVGFPPDSSQLWILGIDTASASETFGTGKWRLINQSLETDSTLDGSGTEESNLGVDTSIIATKHYVDSVIQAGVSYYYLSSDFTTTATSAQNITGLSFTPSANKRYLVSGYLLLRSSNVNTGVRHGINWPSGGVVDNIGRANSSYTAVTATAVTWLGTSSGTLTNPTGVVNTTTSHYSLVDAYLIMGASPSGNFQVTLASETNGTTVTCKAGSFIKVEILPF